MRLFRNITRSLGPWIALALSACANEIAASPTCDGQHRRPANPHGSVLVGQASLALVISSKLTPNPFSCEERT